MAGGGRWRPTVGLGPYSVCAPTCRCGVRSEAAVAAEEGEDEEGEEEEEVLDDDEAEEAQA